MLELLITPDRDALFYLLRNNDTITLDASMPNEKWWNDKRPCRRKFVCCA